LGRKKKEKKRDRRRRENLFKAHLYSHRGSCKNGRITEEHQGMLNSGGLEERIFWKVMKEELHEEKGGAYFF